MMSRKDYVIIADGIRQAWDLRDEGLAVERAFDHVARCIADNLAQDNPRFDRQKFLRAALDLPRA